MKWFFALNEQSPNFHDYCKMIKVAVYTGYLYTSLQPYFIYDGQENDFTAWLRQRNVKIIHHRSSFYNDLLELSESTQREWILSMGAGAFMRIDLPYILSDLGIKDEFIVYTDTDVMFLDDVSFAQHSDCPFFAVAPEIDIEDNVNINTGVMVMNIPNLRRDYAKFCDFTRKFLFDFASLDWDQTAYRTYYHMEWNALNPLYNWKPYWGAERNAKILHFHGLKPTVVEDVKNGNLTGRACEIATMSGDEYYRQVEIWQKFLNEAEKPFSFDDNRLSRDETVGSSPKGSDSPDGLRNKLVLESKFAGLCDDPSRCDWRAVKGKLVLWILIKKDDVTEDIKAYLALSRFFVLIGNFHNAIFHAGVANSLAPDSAETITWLGELYFRQGDAPKAIRTLEDGLEKNPTDLDLILLLAKVHLALQQHQASFEYYKKAEEISPGNPAIDEGLSRLEELKSTGYMPR